MTDPQNDLLAEAAHHRLSVRTDREPHCSWCDEAWPCLTTRLAARVRALEEDGKRQSERNNPSCSGCGGPHPFDTSMPSVVWNAVIRARDLPEYLCLTCIVREFARQRQSFTATLWGDEFSGVPIEVRVDNQPARDAHLVGEENSSFRAALEIAAEDAERLGVRLRAALSAAREAR